MRFVRAASTSRPADADAFLVHHVEHHREPLVRLPDEIADRPGPPAKTYLLHRGEPDNRVGGLAFDALVEQLYDINKKLVSLEGRLFRLGDGHGVGREAVTVIPVPGAFELPLCCQWLCTSGRHDAVLADAFLQVANLQASPMRLLHPPVALRVLRGNLVRRPRNTAAATPAATWLPLRHSIRLTHPLATRRADAVTKCPAPEGPA